MQPVVYIDMLFLLNLIMDSVILFATSVFLKKEPHIIRMSIAAIFGATYSSLMFFPQLSVIYTAVFKAIFLFLTVWIAFPEKTVRKLLKNASVFFSVYLIFGGIVFTLIFATDFGTTVGTVVSNGEIYFDVSIGTILVSAAMAYIIIYIISYIKKENARLDKITVDVQIFFNGKFIRTKALCDTGCNLADPITGTPAIIISPRLAKDLLPKDIPIRSLGDKYRILPFSTVDSQKGIMHGFVPDNIIIQNHQRVKAVVGISHAEMTEFSAILNCDILKQTTHGKVVTHNNEAELHS